MFHCPYRYQILPRHKKLRQESEVPDVYKRQVHGSVNSHTAILARTMGIPALVSTEMELTQDLDGKLAVVDGNHGTIYVDPDAETMEKMETLKKEEMCIRDRNTDFRAKSGGIYFSFRRY